MNKAISIQAISWVLPKYRTVVSRAFGFIFRFYEALAGY